MQKQGCIKVPADAGIGASHTYANSMLLYFWALKNKNVILLPQDSIPLGVSNEFIDKVAGISVEKGALLILGNYVLFVNKLSFNYNSIYVRKIIAN